MKQTYFKKFSLLLLFMSCNLALTYAQTPSGKISGIIKTTDGKPAPGVTVTLMSLHKTTLTNENGTYILQNILELLLQSNCLHQIQNI